MMSRTRIHCNECGFAYIYCQCKRHTPQPSQAVSDSDLLKKVKNMFYRKRCDDGSIEYMCGDGHIESAISLITSHITQKHVELIDNADVISNPRARRNAIKAIKGE